jgi:serine/threonine protein kinase
MSSATATHIELPLGYSILDRLGAGGYGEVWKATAPGGLEKAVKIVFGHCDEGMAERELKSLERIKSVRHPFLLSIERFEIVNNRLVIVTELADMSLNDCFEAYVTKGHTGIPREQLIDYLWDAADALDCLLEQHSLQHLDIKPENLLVVGDHIKVADFGLVKELAQKTLNSMMGGMTPLYSAPEIYDNNPSSRSDQYSLAIVYQQMLTGTLPFSGRTPAQLAKQHTLTEPNLNSLSEADRLIVRRAMEKDPQNRFASCRAFVAALRAADKTHASTTSTALDTNHFYASKQLQNDDTKSLSIGDTDHLQDPVCSAATQILSEIRSIVEESCSTPAKQVVTSSAFRYPTVDAKIEDIATPGFEEDITTVSIPTLFIGIGGLGSRMLNAIHDQNDLRHSENKVSFACLAIDTDRDSLKEAFQGKSSSSQSFDEKLHIPLRRPTEYRDDSQALLQWVSRRWLYNIPRSLQTRGFRPLGRIALVDHSAQVLAALHKQLQYVATELQASKDSPQGIRVVVLAGMSGGTGGGTVVDIAQAVRSICGQFSQKVEVHGVLASTFHPESNDTLAAANMYSLLVELSHAQTNGNCGEISTVGPAASYERPQQPFDEIYTVPIPPRSERIGCQLAIQSIADYLLLDTSGVARSGYDALRSPTEHGAISTSLRSFNCVNIEQFANTLNSQLKRQLLKQTVETWLKHDSESTDPDRKLFNPHTNSKFAQAVFRLLPEAQVNSEPGTDVDIQTVSNQRAIRSASIKKIANAFFQYLESFQSEFEQDSPSHGDANLEPLCQNIVAKFCSMFLQNELHEYQILQLLTETIDQQVNDLAESISKDREQALATTVLSLLKLTPLDCGCQRRTLLLSSRDCVDTKVPQAIGEHCSTLADYKSSLSETFLIREGSQLPILHLGARLAELYPDIHEAAGRLHARDDIKWPDLRS